MTTAPTPSFGKVAVLFGGKSAEREISLKSGNAVLAALKSRGIDAHPYDPAEKPVHNLKAEGFERAFVILHGRGGEDGTVQGELEMLGLPYTGSGVMASALGMDKWRTKLVWRGADLPVPDYAILEANSDFDAVEKALGLPLFVKPANEGSSVGISKVKVPGALAQAYADAAKHDPLVLAEKFMGGGEFTVGVLDGKALPVVRIVPTTEFYDYEAKYFRDDTKYLCPCGLSVELEARMQRLAERAFNVLGCRGWGRVDILLDQDGTPEGTPYLLEINTAPGMTDHSLVPMAARVAGYNFPDLCVKVLELARVG